MVSEERLPQDRCAGVCRGRLINSGTPGLADFLYRSVDHNTSAQVRIGVRMLLSANAERLVS